MVADNGTDANTVITRQGIPAVRLPAAPPAGMSAKVGTWDFNALAIIIAEEVTYPGPGKLAHGDVVLLDGTVWLVRDEGRRTVGP